MRGIAGDGEGFGRGPGGRRIHHGGGGIEAATGNGPVAGDGGGVQAGEGTVAEYQASRTATTEHQAQALGRRPSAKHFAGCAGDGEGFRRITGGGGVRDGGGGVEVTTGDGPVAGGCRGVQAGELSTADHQAGRAAATQRQAQTLG